MTNDDLAYLHDDDPDNPPECPFCFEYLESSYEDDTDGLYLVWECPFCEYTEEEFVASWDELVIDSEENTE